MPQESDRTKAYEIVAKAIRFVRSHSREQPSLDDIARHVRLSPHHLQRLFSEWAGISPKRFLQFLTKENAKRLLRQSRDVLGAAVESGLSGPGRLHDLMVACEALTPGEVGALGAGLIIRFGFAPTPLGEIIAGITARGVCHLHFVEHGMEMSAESELRDEWPNAALARDDEAVHGLAERLFGALADPKLLRVLLRGTNFQIKVWEALMRIPAGQLVSYGDVAALAGAPQAARSVGTAIAHNRIAVLVPCHRVIREGGEIGQYRWGSERKIALLAWESVRKGSALTTQR
ncbi:MAG: bifunctional helix-turn-helix domain-containing protein/methylated-DNA--[protein]-cysteine S-methyltransferase [Burkholderiales bacterium]|nr:bifunctional helix-turn-helix domain-containing protein/methylated-DNA--[protein]-cysteine S-methyltransferase [Burkholderiales bacterium]